MIRIVLLGPPGAGKGTQAVRIAEHFQIPAISTGEIFRKNISEQTDLGLKAKNFIENGQLVPDEITDAMVKDRLAQPDCENGFLLDGYPRSLHQADMLAQILAERNEKLDFVLEIQADENEVVKRMLQRAKEQNRADDTEEVFRERMRVYHETTLPLSQHYSEAGLLVEVDGSGTIDEVSELIFKALQK